MTIESKLKKLRKDVKNSDLKNAVIDDILNVWITDDEITNYINDVVNHGCSSGTCNNLIYYKDTYAFAKKHIEDIVELLDNIKEDTGEEFSNWGGDRLNTMAWLAYEETIREIGNDLGMEI